MYKIIIAKNAGFCMGVKRAVNMVLELVSKSKGPVYTYGPLIHNPQVTELLAKKGVIVLSKNKVPKEGTVVVRTHGIPPEIRKKLGKSGVNVYDATCPFVIKVQRIIEEYSKKDYAIIIVGDKGHAEVDSYLGYANGKGAVVSNVSEIDKLDVKGKLCVVAQTTQDKKRFNEIINKILRSKTTEYFITRGIRCALIPGASSEVFPRRYKFKKLNIELKVFDTICNATSKRQEETLNISHKVDAMIVVGGKNSANTLRLAEICRSTGTPTYFVERREELNISELSGFKKIGITAGASTSKETIQDVVDMIKNEITKRHRVSKKSMA